MIHEHLLGGCAPTPLAHYLKALGILRLIAEQKDPEACGRWQGELFVLRSHLNQKELERFFLEEYQPTPILSPWNGRAGYLEGDDGDNSNRTGAVLLKEFRKSNANRFRLYKRLIQEFDTMDSLSEMNLVRSRKKELEKTKKKAGKLWRDEQQQILASYSFREAFLKENIFLTLRNNLDDYLLTWLDGTVALGEDKAFAPLLGSSGGVEGSMDLGVNFMQNLNTLFSLDTGVASAASVHWLRTCLYEELSSIYTDNTSGSLSPGNIGGPNATTGFTVKTGINPWDYILMLEGALLFKPSMTKKLETSQNATLSYPFTTEPTGSGASNVSFNDEKKTRAGRSELWMPIWSMFANYDEISACFKEGSVTLNRGKVRSGLDFARAVSKLGVDRGIDQFQRFIFLKRSGDNDVAVPLGRFNVKSNPLVDLMSDLDRNRWLDSLRLFSRSKDAPGQTRHMTRRLEDGIFSLTQKSDRNTLQGILVLLGQIQLQSANSKKGRESVSPLPLISPEWVIEADDNSHEFRLACALAGLKEMRYNIVPLKINGKANEWDIDSPFAVWGGGDLTANLIKILERRLLRALQEGEEEKPLVGYPQTDLAAVMAFARGETDDRRIAGLLAGLVNADLPRHLPARTISSDEAPAAYKLLKPLFTPDDVLQRMAILPPGKHLPLSRKIVSLLKTGNSKQTTRSLAAVWRCLKNAGLKLPNHPNRPPDVVGIDSARLAAALMVPLTTADMSRICKPFTPKQDVPHFKEETPTDSIP